MRVLFHSLGHGNGYGNGYGVSPGLCHRIGRGSVRDAGRYAQDPASSRSPRWASPSRPACLPHSPPARPTEQQPEEALRRLAVAGSRRLHHLPRARTGRPRERVPRPSRPTTPSAPASASSGRSFPRRGSPASLADRLEAAAAEDADGDGAPTRSRSSPAARPETRGTHRRPPRTPPARATSSRRCAALPRPTAGGRSRRSCGRAVPEGQERGLGAQSRSTPSSPPSTRARGLTPRPEAPRDVLLRRVYLDLIGLPPTPEELHAFLADASPDAYEKVVDRLLASPRYGERWGRHWMDVWRYSDWAGWGAAGPRQPAAHLALARLDRRVAQRRQGLRPHGRGDARRRRARARRPATPCAPPASWSATTSCSAARQWLQDTVEHTAPGVPRRDARLRPLPRPHVRPDLAEGVLPAAGRLRAAPGPHRPRARRARHGEGRPARASSTPSPTRRRYLFVRGDDRKPDKDQPLAPGVPAALGGPRSRIEPVTLPRRRVRAPTRPAFVVDETLAASERRPPRRGEVRRRRSLKAPGGGRRGSAAERASSQGRRRRGRGARRRELAELDGRWPKRDTPRWRRPSRSSGWRTPAAGEGPEALEAGRDRRGDGPALAGLLEPRSRGRGAPRRRRTSAAGAREGGGDEGRPRPPTPRRPTAAQEAAASRRGREGARGRAAKAAEAAVRPTTRRGRSRPIPPTSTGRRLALARWIADRDNPLTARVAVNHIWLRHFGQALVADRLRLRPQRPRRRRTRRCSTGWPPSSWSHRRPASSRGR